MEVFSVASTSSHGSIDAGAGVGGSGVGPDRSKPQRKRKQNKACAACKARKVRCDLVDLEDGAVCTPCRSKGIKCVLPQPPERPRKVNRSGVRVELAKQTLGAVDYGGSDGGTPASSLLDFGCHLALNEATPTPDISDAELDEILRSLSETENTWQQDGARPQQQQHQQPYENEAGPISTQTAAHRLQTSALELGIEQDLLQTFFSKTHVGVQAVNPETFRAMYNMSGRNPQLMTPVNETICALMAAWGARYTTHPAILPQGLDILRCGQARESACERLYLRAKDMLDRHNITREPSEESVQALILASHLSMYHGDTLEEQSRQPYLRSRIQQGDFMQEARILRGVMASHMQCCNMWEPGEEGYGGHFDVSEVIRCVITQRTLWTAWVADSYWSVADYNRPCFDDSAIFDLNHFIPRMCDPLPRLEGLSAPQLFTYLLFAYPMLGEIMRFAGNEIHFRGKRGRIEDKVSQLAPCLKLFQERLTALDEWLDLVAERVIGVLPTMDTFSPLNYYVSVKFGIGQAASFVRENLQDRLDKYTVFKASHATPGVIFSPEGSPPKEDAHLSNLIALAADASEYALLLTRQLAVLVRRLSSGPNLESTGTEHRELRTMATFLASAPTVENGARYAHPRLQGPGWTWARKCSEVGWLLDAMVQVGWSWGLNGVAYSRVLELMESTRPANHPPFVYANRRSPSDLYQRASRVALDPTLNLNGTLATAPANVERARRRMLDRWVELGGTAAEGRTLEDVLVDEEPLFAPPFKLALDDDDFGGGTVPAALFEAPLRMGEAVNGRPLQAGQGVMWGTIDGVVPPSLSPASYSDGL